MNNHTVTDWHQLADQLTPEAAATIERMEGRLSPEVRRSPQGRQALIDVALDEIRRAELEARYAHVPLPPGARAGDGTWYFNEGAGCAERPVEWAQFGTGCRDADVVVDGRQRASGQYTAEVSLYAEDCQLSAEQARALAGALVAAADRLDGLGL